eukprot:TRINITY_DN33218_c0_g1_i1.p1 TRINITY_DN33218_c0_g1~~TRINITY_DN33218_c0_g1_i1.p1  ORF type:complete len:237 (+),score=28.56 TRINITY_DN33218_c0_g1_i1:77-787(+)
MTVVRFFISTLVCGALADNELPTCGSCDACEDQSDSCTSLTLSVGDSEQFCSNIPPDNDKLVAGDVEIASVRNSGSSSTSCGKFHTSFALQSDSRMKFSNSANTQVCYDPTNFGMDAGELFVKSENDQVCLTITCDVSSKHPCNLRYQLKWNRNMTEEEAKAAKKLVLFVALGLFAAFVICIVVQAIIFFCIVVPAYDRSALGGCGFCCAICWCWHLFLLLFFIRACGYCKGKPQQ